MNKFDKVLNEAGALTKAWNKTGDLLSSTGRAFEVAKQAATSTSLQPIINLFSKIKQKLTPVTYKTAKNNVTKNNNYSEYSQGIKDRKFLGKKFIFAKNSVIFNDSGYTGLVGRTIDPNSNLIKTSFKDKIKDKAKVDPEAIIRTAEQNNRFWVVISPKGQLTVDNTRRESQREDQQILQQTPQQTQQQTQQQTGGIRSAIGGAISSLGNKLAGESVYTNIINNYHPEILLEQNEKKIKNVIPYNEIAYNSYYIYDSEFAENIGKFLILPQGKTPNSKIGKTVLMDGDLAGLAQVGNKTFYAKWYFCNEFEAFEQEEEEKEKGPVQSTLKGTDSQTEQTPQTGKSATNPAPNTSTI